MGIPIIGDLINGVKDLISEVVVDKDKRDELNYKIRELEDQANARYHEEVLAQIEVNKTEAEHPSVFVAGWRPFIGWVSGTGIAYSVILEPLMSWVARVAGYTGQFPVLDTSLLMTCVTGMLGIGAMRSYEKVNKVETKGVLVSKSKVTNQSTRTEEDKKPDKLVHKKPRHFKI